MGDSEIRDFLRRRAAAAVPFADEVRGWTEQARIGALAPPVSELVSRLANGKLTRERLELLAYAGDADALALIGGETDEYAASVGGAELVAVIRHPWRITQGCVTAPAGAPVLTPWLSGLGRWGPRPGAAAALGLAESCLAQAQADLTDAHYYATDDGIFAAEEFVDRAGGTIAGAWTALLRDDAPSKQVAAYRAEKLEASSRKRYARDAAPLVRLARIVAGEGLDARSREPWTGLDGEPLSSSLSDIAERNARAMQAVLRFANEAKD